MKQQPDVVGAERFQVPGLTDGFFEFHQNVLALLWGFSAFGQSDTLFISTSQVVHIWFSSELKYVDLGSRDIVAKIVDGSKDFVAVKAREAFSTVTSMSCLESTGQMHTFLVAYREHPSRLEVDTRVVPVSPGLSGGSPLLIRRWFLLLFHLLLRLR